MTHPILTSRDGAILTVTLNLPEKRNPVSDNGLIDLLIETMHAADSDIGIRCVILTGAGSAFSAGGDLKAMKDGTGLRAALPAQTRRNYREGIQRLHGRRHLEDLVEGGVPPLSQQGLGHA